MPNCPPREHGDHDILQAVDGFEVGIFILRELLSYRTRIFERVTPAAGALQLWRRFKTGRTRREGGNAPKITEHRECGMCLLVTSISKGLDATHQDVQVCARKK